MKRILAVILVAVLAITLMPAAFAAEGKTEVVLWNQIFEDWNRAWSEKMVEEFNSDPNQKYTIKQEFVDGAAWDEKVAAARAANVMPDMFLVNYSNLKWNAVDNYIQPLDDLIPQAAWDDLHDNVKEMITVNGNKFAYPMMLEPAVVMYYRKDLLAEKNLEVPKTWEEFINVAKELTTNDMYGATMNYEWSMWGWEYTAAGHWPIADDWASANNQDQGYIDLLTFIGDLYANEYVPLQPLEGYNGSARLVADDSVAITFSGSWGIAAIMNDFPEMAEKIGVAAAPTKDGSPFKSTVGGWTYVIDAKARQPEGAAAFIHWLLGDEPARTASFFEAANFSKYSARKSVDEYLATETAAKDDQWMQTISQDIIPHAIAEPIYAWDISAQMLTAIGEVVTAGLTPEEALANAAEQINQFIQNNNYAEKKPD